MIDNLKKYWFVVLVATIFIAGVGYFAIDQYNSVFRGKTADGKSVVAEIADQDIFTDAYYDQLYEANGVNAMVSLFQKTVLSNMELTPEMAEAAKTSANTVYNNAASNGQAALDSTGEELRRLGYGGIDGLQSYFEDTEKRYELIRQYLKENPDKAEEFIKNNNSMIVSHVLVSSTTTATPTEAETTKMNTVDDALKNGEAFADVAKANSNDEGSALNGGMIGYIDKNNTTYYKEFVQGAIVLTEKGQVSEWIPSQAGFHKIELTANDVDTLLTYPEFLVAYANSDSASINKLLWEKAEELGVTFEDAEVEKEVKTALGLEAAE